jgi:phage gp36-like protein
MYATQSDIVTLYGQNALVVADHNRDGVADSAAVTRALTSASDEIDTYLAARYTLPLASTPEVLRYIGQDLAHFYLYQSEPPTWVQTRFDAARKTLRDIQTGVLPLGIDTTGATVTQTPQDLPQFNAGSKDFARGCW